MTEMNRREWGLAVLGGLAALPAAQAAPPRPPRPRLIERKVAGVALGVESWSFRDRTLDEALAAMAALGLGTCELWHGHVEPKELTAPGASREDLRRWRLATPPEALRAIRAKVEQAGIDVVSYAIDIHTDFTEPEMERVVLIAQAIGARVLTTSPDLSTLPALAHFTRDHGLRLALRNRSRAREGQASRPDDLAKALAGLKGSAGFALDLGDFVAAGFDPIDFLVREHARVLTLHLEDRRRDQGPSVAWGEGDTPIARVLQLLRDRKWRIPALIEYEYAGKDTIDEVRRCLAFCKKALA